MIGSGIQIIYDNKKMVEKWDKNSRKKLFELLYKYNIHTIFLSGDVHMSEIG
jgi:hypothetical protein